MMKNLSFNIGAVALAFILAGSAQAIPLLDLVGGATVTAGDKLFDQWNLLFADASDPGLLPNLVDIDVTALNDGGLDPGPGLQFDVQNGALDVTGDGVFAFVDVTFSFRVSTTDPRLLIKDNSLTITGDLLNIIDDLGMFIHEDLVDAAGNSLGTKDVELSHVLGFDIVDLVDAAEFAPTNEIFVTKNILVWATDPAETASLQGFTQRFSQQAIPEPATWLLMGIGLAGLWGGRRLMVPNP